MRDRTSRGAWELRVWVLFLPLHLFLLLPRREKQEALMEGTTGALEQVSPVLRALSLGGINGASKMKSHKGQLSQLSTSTNSNNSFGLHKEKTVVSCSMPPLGRLLFNSDSYRHLPVP